MQVTFKYKRANDFNNNVNLNDGLYFFWIDNNTVKLVNIKYKRADKTFDISERTMSLSDTCLVHGIVENEFNVEFDPYSKHTPDKAVFTADRIAVVSDIHGNYNHLVTLLSNHRIIDNNSNWIWGDGHLVINGDIFDRGPGVTECLWLIKKLEKQAEESEGKIHYLLGNHELMVLERNFMSVHDK